MSEEEFSADSVRAGAAEDTVAPESLEAESVDLDYMRSVLDGYRGSRGAMIPVLQAAQTKYGYLPREVIELVSEQMRVSVAHVVGVASFYAQFRLSPRGKYLIRICCGTACHVRGSQQLVEAAEKQMKTPIGQTSEDKLFTAERVACIGACSLAPVITVNAEAIGNISREEFETIFVQYK